MISPNKYKHLADDSAMIQAAVDEAVNTGDSVCIPRLNERTGEEIWNLPHSIKLHSDSTILLDNSHLRMADESFENIFVNSHFEKPICTENRQYNIHIAGTGNAVLDGGKHNGVYDYLFVEHDPVSKKLLRRKTYKGLKNTTGNIFIRMINVEGITVKDITFKNPRYFSLSFYYCERGHISNLNFNLEAKHPNLDGINLRAGCSDFLIENLYGNTGDDSVALTTLWDMKDQNMGLSMDIHDVIIRNVHTRLSSHCDPVRILNQGGAKVYNVLIDGVFDMSGIGSEQRPLATVRIGDLNDFEVGMPKAKPGETYNITVKNVYSRARFGVYMAQTLTDSILENVKMYDDGGIAVYANQCYLENVTFRDFGYTTDAVQPDSYIGYEHVWHKVTVERMSGMYFRDCSGKNVRVEGFYVGKDLPYAFVADNSSLKLKVRDVVFQNEKTKMADGIEVMK